MDPFVKLQYGAEALLTNVISNGGKQPEWNQQFEIHIYSMDEFIHFACLDKDVIADDLVGHTLLPVSTLEQCSGHACWLNIYYKKKVSGKLLIEIFYVPTHEEVAAVVPQQVQEEDQQVVVPEDQHDSLSDLKKWLVQQEGGNINLIITVHSGKLIRDTEAIGEMDPYVYVECRGQRYKTSIIEEGGKNPRWDQDLTIPMVSFTDRVIIGCNEQDLITDDIIGSTDMEFYEIINLNGFKKWIDINYKN